MTNIYLHGELAQIFGKFFALKINNVLSALRGIDANRSGFLQKISSLSRNGIHYCIIANNEKYNIDGSDNKPSMISKTFKI